MPDLVIFGTGELARLANHYFTTDSDYDVVAFTADTEAVGGRVEFEQRPLIEYTELPATHPPNAVELFIAIGYRRVNRARAEVYERALASGYTLASFVSSHAIVSPAATIGCNCFLFEGVIVQPFTAIGDDTIIWSGAVVAHDTQVGRHCFLAPLASVSGNVAVGDYSFIGNNATVRDGVRLGEATVVGAAAVAKWDTEPGAILRPYGLHPLSGRSSFDLDDL